MDRRDAQRMGTVIGFELDEQERLKDRLAEAEQKRREAEGEAERVRQELAVMERRLAEANLQAQLKPVIANKVELRGGKPAPRGPSVLHKSGPRDWIEMNTSRSNTALARALRDAAAKERNP